MRTIPLCLALLIQCVGSVCAEGPNWKKAQEYLDSRQKDWYENFTKADRGTGATKTSCLCCHTLVPYGLAMPVIRKQTSTTNLTKYEEQLIKQTRLRVKNWADLDSEKLGLMYEFDEAKKKESWGTEAVLNCLVLASHDRDSGRTEPHASTKEAFKHLWSKQENGSWAWLDFRGSSQPWNFQPWESADGRYFGATLAAVAVGTAPGYYKPGEDETVDTHVKKLREYLRSQFANQNLHHRLFALWASTKLSGILKEDETKNLIKELFEKQQADGGWNLSQFGKYRKSYTQSEGTATALVVFILREAGVATDHDKLKKGIAWLRNNQRSTGEWRGVSVNKNRDFSERAGKFMTDAATGFAILALRP